MKTCLAILGLLCVVPLASAEPLHVQFNAEGYGPVASAQTYAKDGLTFRSLGPGVLSWDALDGFGIAGEGYEGDEIEGTERLELRFDEAVNVLGFGVTDLFHERMPALSDCPAPGCYLEFGAAQFEYADGSRSLFNVFNAPLTNTLSNTNGVLDIVVNEQNVVAILFMAPGEIFNPAFPMFSEFALANVTVDYSKPIPEPATWMLLSAGLVAVWRRVNTRKA